MGATQELLGFWSSLITKKGIESHLVNLMDINDLEERGLSLMSRVFFLWCMGLRYQRKDLEHLVSTIYELLSNEENSDNCAKCSQIKKLINDNIASEKSERSGRENDESVVPKNILKRKHFYSPQKPKRVRIDNKENVDSSPEEERRKKILAPETQLFSQRNLKEELIIPETIPTDGNLYGNTDFFQMSDSFGSESSPELIKEMKSPILGKFAKTNTPVSSKTKRALYLLKSPKQNDLIRVEKVSKNTSTLSLESVSNSPSLLSCNRLEPSQSPREKKGSTSPLKEKQNNSPTSKQTQDSVTTKISPSPKNITSSSPPSQPKSVVEFFMPRDEQTLAKKIGLVKAKSEMGGATSTRLSKLTRNQTLSSFIKSKPKNMTIDVDYTPQMKKNYRQTKITSDCFIKKTDVAKLTGGKVDAVMVETSDESDNIVAKAIHESIRTKEIEDMMRKKQKQLNAISPVKMKILNQRKTNKKVLTPSLKEEGKAKASTSRSPLDRATQVTEEEVLEGLEAMSESRKEEEGKINSKLKRNIKKSVFQDSFDILPPKDNTPDFAYKGDVARKKADKNRLGGWDCHECRAYYEGKGLSEAEKKAMQNKCSRHRSKHRPVTNTPEGFWVVGWSDDEDDTNQ